jgi:hypothetical protein
MATYTVRVHDSRTGKQLGVIENRASPYACGEVMADAWTVLIFRDGHRPEHLDMKGSAFEDGERRPFNAAEQAAMVSALEQRMAEMRQQPRTD